MEVTVKNAIQNQQHGDVVFGTLDDGSVIVRGKHSSIVIKSGKRYAPGDGWGHPTNLQIYPAGTEIIIKV